MRPATASFWSLVAPLKTKSTCVLSTKATAILKAIQVGGRKQWRIERAKLEEYIAEAYRRTAENLHRLPAKP